MSIKVGKGIPVILIYAFNGYDDLCYLDVKAWTGSKSSSNAFTTCALYSGS